MEFTWKQEPAFRMIAQPQDCTEDICFCCAVRSDGKMFQSHRKVTWNDEEQIQKAKEETLREIQAFLVVEE